MKHTPLATSTRRDLRQSFNRAQDLDVSIASARKAAYAAVIAYRRAMEDLANVDTFYATETLPNNYPNLVAAYDALTKALNTHETTSFDRFGQTL